MLGNVSRVRFNIDSTSFRLYYYKEDNSGFYTLYVTTYDAASDNYLALDYYNYTTQQWSGIFKCNSVL